MTPSAPCPEDLGDRRRGLLAARELGPEIRGHRGMDVEPGEIHRLERPDSRPAGTEAVDDGAVDVLERADARVHEGVGLPQERVLQPIDDEARDVAPDDDRLLAQLVHPVHERVHRRRGGLLGAHDLDQLDELRRVQPVQARETLGPAKRRGERSERQRRRVRRQDRVGRRQLLCPYEELALRLELLDDRLDHELGACERLVGGRRHPHAARVLPEPRAGGLEARLAARAQPHRGAGVREDARDPCAHRAGADHGHLCRELHRRQRTTGLARRGLVSGIKAH